MLTPEQQAAVERLELTARDRLFGFQPTGMRDDILLLISALRTCLKDSAKKWRCDCGKEYTDAEKGLGWKCWQGHELQPIVPQLSHPQPRKEM